MKHFHYDEIDSTNEEAKRLLKKGFNESFYITANSQTSGKGTRGRAWSSPKEKGIYLSIAYISNKDPLENTTLYTLACGVACIETLEETYNINIKIKPINDLYFNSKKLGGILVEGALSKDTLSSIILGIGINIKKTEHSLDREYHTPISLEEIINTETFTKLNTVQLIKGLVKKNIYYLEKIKTNKKLIENTWNKYCLNIS